MKKIISIFIISIMITIQFSYAHPGRTDANGGHYDRSTGEYHYHNENSSYENQLIIEDDDNDNSSSYHEYVVNRLSKSIESKQKTIDKLNDEIEELNQKVENNKIWHFIYIAAIIIFTMYLYGIKNEYKKYETLSKIIMKGLGTSDIDKAIADSSKFYADQEIEIEGDKK